jgi:nucleotide-binding universal stress UspA family protein
MYEQIVVGTDGSTGANIAVDTAIELARLTGATLHVVNAHKVAAAYQLAATPEVGIPIDAIDASNQAVHSEAQRVCDQAVTRAGRVGVHAEAHCLAGNAADSLLKVAEDTQCDLLVVGNRGMAGARRFVLGSVPNKLSHHSPSSLLIVDTTAART